MKTTILGFTLLSLLLLLFKLVTITYANPILITRDDYSLDCSSGGLEFQKYCSNYPYKYSCNQGNVNSATEIQFCESNCKCNGPEGEGEPLVVKTEDLAGTDDNKVKSTHLGDMTVSTSTDLTLATPSITKRHDYVLICDSTNTGTTSTWSRICSNSPYKYYCTANGGVQKQNVNAVCDLYCSCAKVTGNTCFVGPLGLSPICSDMDTSNNSTNSTDQTMPVDEPTDTPTRSIEVRENGLSLYKRHDYALVCDNDGKTSNGRYCIAAPRKYTCTPTGQVRSVLYDVLCELDCHCKDLGKTCVIGPLLAAPICSDNEPSADSTNRAVNKIEQELARSTGIRSISSEPVPDDAIGGTTTPSSFPDLAPAQHKRLSHNYALICDDTTETGSLYTRYCSNRPRTYYCTSQGRVKYSDDDTLCDAFCSCISVTPNCYVHPLLVTPICASVETGDITDMQTGVVVGHLDSNGTAIYDGPVRKPRSLSSANEAEEMTTDNVIDDHVVDSSTNAAPVTEKLAKRHDYALICKLKDSAPSGTLYNFCVGYPYKYSCTATGTKSALQRIDLCEQVCACSDIVRSCYVTPWLIKPVCADVETGEITDEETGVVVGHFDNSGTAVYYQNSTTTE